MVVLGPDEKVTEIAGRKGGTHFTAFEKQGELGGILLQAVHERRVEAVKTFIDSDAQAMSAIFRMHLVSLVESVYSLKERAIEASGKAVDAAGAASAAERVRAAASGDHALALAECATETVTQERVKKLDEAKHKAKEAKDKAEKAKTDATRLQGYVTTEDRELKKYLEVIHPKVAKGVKERLEWFSDEQVCFVSFLFARILTDHIWM